MIYAIQLSGRSENQLRFIRKFIALSRQRVNTLLSDFRSRKLKFGDRDHAIFLGEYGSPTAPLALGREMAVIRAYRETRRSVIAVTTLQIMHSFMPTLTLHGRANARLASGASYIFVPAFSLKSLPTSGRSTMRFLRIRDFHVSILR